MANFFLCLYSNYVFIILWMPVIRMQFILTERKQFTLPLSESNLFTNQNIKLVNWLQNCRKNSLFLIPLRKKNSLPWLFIRWDVLEVVSRMERVGEIELFHLDKNVLTHVNYCEGLEGGILIPHSRPFFARIPHPARFSSVSRIPLFFPTKIH